jgi:U3 small nucleolar RNA-associated protein 10
VGAYGSEQFLVKMMVMDSLISQRTLEELMEQVVSLLQLVDASRKQKSIPVVVRKELKECMHAVLRHITMHMIPSAYFKGIIKLLGQADGNVKKKVLMMESLFIT